MVFSKADGFVHKRGQLHGMVVAVVVLLFLDNLSVFRHSNGTDISAGFDMQYAGHMMDWGFSERIRTSTKANACTHHTCIRTRPRVF